jgi:hypothetical protein
MAPPTVWLLTNAEALTALSQQALTMNGTPTRNVLIFQMLMGA